MLPGGDLYEKEKEFFEMVESRSDHEVEDWLKSVHIHMIEMDGTRMIDDNVDKIIRWLQWEII